MYTANDISTVIAYNKTGNIFRVTPTGRITWDLRNIDVTNLNAQLSKPLVYAEDFAQLKKQVRVELTAQAAV